MIVFGQGLMPRCAKLPWQLHLKRLICTCRLLHHYSTSFCNYFSCFTFLSSLLCIPREWDANLHVSIATMGRCSFKVMHPLDVRAVSGFPASKYNYCKKWVITIYLSIYSWYHFSTNTVRYKWP